MRLRSLVSGSAFHDFWRKLGALVLATTLWLWVWTEQSYETMDVTDLPVVVKYDDSKLVCLSDPPPKVSLTLTGNAKRFSQLRRQEIVITAEVAETMVHGHSLLTLELKPDQVQLPLGLSVAEIKPPRLNLEFDQIESRDITVRPQWYGVSDDSLVRYMVSPHTVKISGPSRFLSRRPFVQTEPIELKAIPAEGVQVEAAIEPGPHLQAFPARVSVVFKGGVQTESRQFNFIPVQWLVDPGARWPVPLEMPRVAVTVAGPAIQVQNLDAGAISSFVDLRGLNPAKAGRQELPIQVWIKGNPGGIEVRQVSPSTLPFPPAPAAAP